MRSTPVLEGHESAALEVAAAPAAASARFARRAGAFFLHEFREMLPPTIFFMVDFNLIVLTTNLILADYSVAFASFMLATAAALVVGKSVLVANADGSASPLRPRAVDPTDPIQNGILLGYRIHCARA